MLSKCMYRPGKDKTGELCIGKQRSTLIATVITNLATRSLTYRQNKRRQWRTAVVEVDKILLIRKVRAILSDNYVNYGQVEDLVNKYSHA